MKTFLILLAVLLSTQTAHAATFTVTNANNSGSGSLRQALTDANATSATDTIVFNISGTGLHTITPTSALPEITNPVVIDGYTQPGASANTLSSGNNAVVRVELNGTSAGNGVNGLRIRASFCTVKGLAINRFTSQGILLTFPGGHNVVAGCLLGTTVSGAGAAGNLNGVFVDRSPGNTIGGTTSAARNLISGNRQSGLAITGALTPPFGSDANVVQGNYIGTNKGGTARLANADEGILLQASNTTIGGTTSGARNVIAGNSKNGIRLFGDDHTTGNKVQGNFIGTDVTGLIDLGNTLDGVKIEDVPNTTIGGTIGGTISGARNVISGNDGHGVRITGVSDGNGADGTVVQGNLIGLASNGTAALGNALDGVFSSRAAGISIGGAASGVRNVISGNGGNGVEISSTTDVTPPGNVVQGNFIGLNSAGTAAVGNALNGVLLTADARRNFIGGQDDSDGASDGVVQARNVISGNGDDGVEIATSGTESGGTADNHVRGNFIGTDVKGTTAIGNVADGVRVVSGPIKIGVTLAGAGNLISGNGGNGIEIISGATVQANLIGIAANGVPLGNGANGILVSGGDIGDVVAGAGNRIGFNKQNGVAVTGDAARASIRGNAIFVNTGLGIDLGADGVTPNDKDDADTGPNALQNFPVVAEVANLGTTTLISGSLNSLPNRTYALDFYRNTSADPSGFGEGEVFIGSVDVTTDSAGDATFAATLPTAVPVGQFVSATATQIGFGSTGTSEFSGAVRTISVRFVVNTNDSGPGSLRQAMLDANAAPPTEIRFNIPTSDPGFSGGVFTIRPTSALPVITANGTFLNGPTQTAFTGNTNAAGPEIVLNGVTAGAGVSGLSVTAANCKLQTLVINGFDGDGVTISGAAATSNQILGCYLGTNAAGNAAVPNGLDGVAILGAPNNTVGGTSATLRNVISGNAVSGVELAGTGTTGNVLRGNFIGTNASGTAAVPNGGDGVDIDARASLNTIGGTTAAARNVIAGNAGAGVLIFGAGTTGNKVQGNFIGANAGSGALPNGAEGVFIGVGASGNSIGARDGTNVAAITNVGNRIAFNGGDGVLVTGSGTGNTVRGNAMRGNLRLGLNLQPGGEADGTVTPNDTGDGDAGPNRLQNFPVLTTAAVNSGATTITGTLNGTANAAFTLDFYRSAGADPSNFGEGEVYLGNVAVTTDGSGNASFSFSVTGLFGGQAITATATNASGDTSEFSRAIVPVGVRSFTPESGAAGTSVTISGRGFLSATAVRFNGVRAGFHIDSADQITALVPDGVTTGRITVTTPAGTARSASDFLVSACAADATGQVHLTRGELRLTGSYSQCLYGHCRFTQIVTLENTSATPIAGPLALVLDNLGNGATLSNASGTTECSGLSGSPFVTAPGDLNPGATTSVTLEFEAAHAADIRYAARVLAGPGER